MVLFGPFCPLRSYLLDIGLIQSILVLFGPIRFYLIHYVHIGPNLSIHSYSVLSSLQRSYSVHIGTLYPIWTTLVLFFFFFFGENIQSIFVNLHIGKIHVWVESAYPISKFINKNMDLKLVISKIFKHNI